MDSAPWITIVGLGEDGLESLSTASRKAVETAEIVMGSKRHLGLLPPINAECVEWPVPFATGLDILTGYNGRKVVVLASGNPFWFGAGSVIARNFSAEEWQAFPTSSAFSLAANRLGWPLEKTICLGLHAAPLTRLRPYLAAGVRCLVLMRDGEAIPELARYLTELGFGDTKLCILEALGGPREKFSEHVASKLSELSVQHPVCVGITVAGEGAAISSGCGLPDDLFETDGVMTKRPMRALTLSALAPVAGETLWDIGGGSGSIAIEWLLSDTSCQATIFEPKPERVGIIEKNAMSLGVDRLNIVLGRAPEAVAKLPSPDAVFVGGGLSKDLLAALEDILPQKTRLVINSVTLETEVLLTELYGRKGGELTRFEVSQARALGTKTGWKASYPVVQWSGTL